MNDEIISKILAYINDHPVNTGVNAIFPSFERRSYSNWAACELLNSIMDRPFDQIIDVIDDFIIKMVIFSHNHSFKKNNPFSIAIDVAEDIKNFVK